MKNSSFIYSLRNLKVVSLEYLYYSNCSTLIREPESFFLLSAYFFYKLIYLHGRRFIVLNDQSLFFDTIWTPLFYYCYISTYSKFLVSQVKS